MPSTVRAIALTAALLAACGGGGGGGGGGNNTPPPGPVNQPLLSLHLQDGPPELVTSVRLHVLALQVHVDDMAVTTSHAPDDATIDDDGKWKSLPVDKVVDLVQHQGEAAAASLGSIVLPEGRITQARLVLDTTKEHFATWGGIDCVLDLSLLAPQGVKLDHSFPAIQVLNEEKVDVWVDYDLGEAMEQRGDCFRLKPTLRLARATRNGVDSAVR